MKAEKQKKINGIFNAKWFDKRIFMMDDFSQDLRPKRNEWTKQM